MTEINVRPLPPLLAKIAETELNENPNRIPSDLEAIKTWLDKQTHITARKDDQFLVAFLRGCKYSLERTKEKLDMYYTIKTACPEIFGLRDPNDLKIRSLLNLGVSIPLPVTHADGSRITVSRPCSFDPHKVNMTDVIKASFMVGDLLILEDDYTVIGGQTNIIDLKGMTMAHSGQITASFVRKISTAIQDAYPNRIKAFHFINGSTAFELIFKIFYQFLSEKLRKRVFIHSSLEDLHAHVPKHLLPEEYGGQLEPLPKINSDLVRRIISQRDWFVDDINYRTEESKRTGILKNANLLFGVDGSFRKLEFD